MNINLLIVEDEELIINMWKQSLALYAVEEERKYDISAIYTDNLLEASRLISVTNFDAIVIDIRLKNDDDQANRDGNSVMEDAISRTMSVIAVCTAEPDTVELSDEQNTLVEVFRKGVIGQDVVQQCIQWLESKQTLISSVQNMRAHFDIEMAKLFSKSIWPRWKYWLNAEQEKHIAEKALTRHMATHLHASFLNQVPAVHPEEYYFIPPIQNRLDTGDIVFHEENYKILVTPRCDLARGKNPTFQLVNIINKKERWDELHTEKVNGANSKVRDKAVKEIRNIVNHGDRSPKLHFIPQFKLIAGDELGPFHAQFNFMDCVEATEENRSMLTEQRVATLSNEFVPSLVERLGAYFSRIGTPDYSHPE